jgi:dihydrodipicolinate synthase/N-acetylneuraminate lyase
MAHQTLPLRRTWEENTGISSADVATTDQHFRPSTKQFIAYDIPVSVHVKLNRSTVAELAREGTIAGLKDSSGDEGGFRHALLDAAGLPDFFAMTGAELTADCAMLMGAAGIVPGLANVDPHGYIRLYEAACRGDWTAARAEQDRLCRLFEIVRVGNAIIANAYRVNSIKVRLIRQEQTLLSETLVTPVMQEHLSVIEAIETRDPVHATAAMDKHIASAKARALGVV